MVSLAFVALQSFSVLAISKERHIAVPYLISAAFSLVASLGACLLSFVEHRWSVRPSGVLVLYLLASLAESIVRVTAPKGTRLEVGKSRNLAIVRVGVELVFLVVESQNKTSLLRKRYREGLSPEEKEGVLGRTLFWWINPILGEGYRSVLIAEDLPPIDEKLSSGNLRERFLSVWSKRGLASPFLYSYIYTVI